MNAPRGTLGCWLLALVVALFGVALLRTAWLCDDAYITFRTVHNLTDGHGPRWNLADRVQTYTHPLWMGVVALCHLVTSEIYFTVLVLSALLSLAAVISVGVSLATSAAAGVCAVVLLTASRAFVDYSTSGLENPLSHVLLAAMLWLWFRERAAATRLRGLCVLGGLLIVNRLDLVLLVAPAIAVASANVGPRRALRAAAPGALVPLLWFGFATFYYGSPFPITAHAKAFDTGLPRADLLAQGLRYLADTARHDPITIAGIVAAAVASLLRPRSLLPWVAGVVAYLGYVVWIGGDFMSGRFLAAPLFVSAIVIARVLPAAAKLAVPAVLLVAVVGWFGRTPSILSGADYAVMHPTLEHGISDERHFQYRRLGLLSPECDPPRFGVTLALTRAQNMVEPRFVIARDAGVRGFEMGADGHLIDVQLGDPLLARLPTFHRQRVGHYVRRVPEGYYETLFRGENRLRHAGLAAYWKTLSLVVRDDLWSGERLRALGRLWTGADGDGRRAFIAEDYFTPPLTTVAIDELAQRVDERTAWYDPRVRIVYEGGIEVQLGEVANANALEIGLGCSATYQIEFRRDGASIDKLPHMTNPVPLNGLSHARIEVPEAVRPRGFDAVRILAWPVGTLGHVVLVD